MRPATWLGAALVLSLVPLSPLAATAACAAAAATLAGRRPSEAAAPEEKLFGFAVVAWVAVHAVPLAAAGTVRAAAETATLLLAVPASLALRRLGLAGSVRPLVAALSLAALGAGAWGWASGFALAPARAAAGLACVSALAAVPALAPAFPAGRWERALVVCGLAAAVAAGFRHGSWGVWAGVAALAGGAVAWPELRRSKWAAVAAAAVAAAAAAGLVWRAPATGASGAWARSWSTAGLLGPASTVLLLGVVLAHSRRRLGDRDPARRATAWTGMALAAGVATVGLTEPAFGSLRANAFLAAALAVPYGVDAIRRRASLAAPVARRFTLSATVITKNEADRIRECLDSLAGWVDEIVVVDSGSTDGTVEIARGYTDRVWVTDWPGFGAQKQRAIERATGDWVLSIDADEVVSPELRHDVDVALSSESDHVGYKLPWAVTLYGKRLDFGRSARAPLRLFRRKGARFTETHVHERVVLPAGDVGILEGRLIHYSHRDYGHALEKSARYAWLGARDRLAARKRGGGLPGATVRAVLRFIQVWILRFGFLDGGVGFLIAMGYAQSSFNKYAGLWTLERDRGRREHES